MNVEGLELSILGPACVAGLLVLSTHVPLGQQVLAPVVDVARDPRWGRSA